MKKSAASDWGERLFSFGLLAFGAYILFETRGIAGAQGYEQLGPRLFPMLIGASMMLCGVGLSWQSLSGGWHDMPEQSEHKRPDWFAFGVISAALVLHMALVGIVGFVLATTLMFTLAARGFGSRRWKRDVATGAALSTVTFYLFTLALGLHLPASPLGVI
jgi:putative tricarboxylic transport membrane protein